jgi:hypothetical protein
LIPHGYLFLFDGAKVGLRKHHSMIPMQKNMQIKKYGKIFDFYARMLYLCSFISEKLKVKREK